MPTACSLLPAIRLQARQLLGFGHTEGMESPWQLEVLRNLPTWL